MCSRVRLLAADRVSFGVLLATRGGAFAWLQPLTSQHHATLAALQSALHTGVAHAGRPSTQSDIGCQVQTLVLDQGRRAMGFRRLAMGF